MPINLGYVVDQLARALGSGNGPRSTRWIQVLDGIRSGQLTVGSRTPLKDTPAWATLEVMKGGFATGALAAAGDERAYDRNLEALTDDGRVRLGEVLRSGAYAVHVPEEAALLVLTLLVERGEAERAAELLEQLAPFFERLRFYPAPSAGADDSSDRVFRFSAGQVARALREAPPNERVETMNRSLTTGFELRVQVVALLLETVDGPAPLLVETGEARSAANRGYRVEGGWPGRNLPAGWNARARALVKQAAGARGSLRLLVEHLDRIAEGVSTPRELGALRRILAGELRKRGAPGSEQRAALRAEQARVAALPTHRQLRHALAGRLDALPAHRGVRDVAALSEPVLGVEVPPSVARVVARCLEATIDELVEKGVVGSGEVLASLLPRVVGRLRASTFDDVELARLHARTYEAFRRRRSLLLLNLEGQVRFEELPWVRALEALAPVRAAVGDDATHAVSATAALALHGFPHVIVPNKLLTELRALAKSASLEIPLVEELAADIFQGAFGRGFVRAGHAAARLLSGSLYARYYAVPYERVAEIDDLSKQRDHAAASSPEFFAVCAALAGRPSRWSVAANGTIIEQQQIVTTQNLAALFELPGLESRLAAELVPMAKRCFDWMLWRLKGRQQPSLAAVKNVAYAWRQLVFFLSRAPEGQHGPFLAWAKEELAHRRGPYQLRLGRVVDGLGTAMLGGDPGDMRLLGWTTRPHWLRS